MAFLSLTTTSDAFTSGGVLSNNNVTMTTLTPPVPSDTNNNNLENRTYTLGPPDTIWGLEVELFSYVFLAIGGVAPVVFILIVVISMRCYTWRKLRRFQRYEARYRTGMELWESEKKYSSVRDLEKGRHAYDGPGQVISDEESGPSGGSDPSGGGVSVKSPEDYRTLTASTNNPNVYFREVASNMGSPANNGPVPHRGGGRRRHESEPVRSDARRVPNGDARRSINSEEQRALDCFDKIYESLDISESESLGHPSRGGHGGRVGLQRMKPPADRTQSLSTMAHSSPQIRRTISGTQSPGGGSLPGTPSRRPMVQITARQPPAETATGDPLEQRQSWLHSSFVNVAYDLVDSETKAEDAKIKAEKAYDECTEVARKELQSYHRQNLLALQEGLTMYAEAKVKTARDTYALLAKSLTVFKTGSL